MSAIEQEQEPRKQAPAAAYFSPENTGRCRPNQDEHGSVEQALQHIEDRHAEYMNSVTRDLQNIDSGLKQFPEEPEGGMTHSPGGRKFAPDDSVGTVDFPLGGQVGPAKRVCPSWEPNASELSDRKYAF